MQAGVDAEVEIIPASTTFLTLLRRACDGKQIPRRGPRNKTRDELVDIFLSALRSIVAGSSVHDETAEPKIIAALGPVVADGLLEPMELLSLSWRAYEDDRALYPPLFQLMERAISAFLQSTCPHSPQCREADGRVLSRCSTEPGRGNKDPDTLRLLFRAAAIHCAALADAEAGYPSMIEGFEFLLKRGFRFEPRHYKQVALDGISPLAVHFLASRVGVPPPPRFLEWVTGVDASCWATEQDRPTEVHFFHSEDNFKAHVIQYAYDAGARFDTATELSLEAVESLIVDLEDIIYGDIESDHCESET